MPWRRREAPEDFKIDWQNFLFQRLTVPNSYSWIASLSARLTTRQKQYSSDSAHKPVNLVVHARFLLSLVELVGVIATYQSATIRMVGPFVHNIQAPSLLPVFVKI